MSTTAGPRSDPRHPDRPPRHAGPVGRACWTFATAVVLGVRLDFTVSDIQWRSTLRYLVDLDGRAGRLRLPHEVLPRPFPRRLLRRGHRAGRPVRHRRHRHGAVLHPRRPGAAAQHPGAGAPDRAGLRGGRSLAVPHLPRPQRPAQPGRVKQGHLLRRRRRRLPAGDAAARGAQPGLPGRRPHRRQPCQAPPAPARHPGRRRSRRR